MYRSMYNFICRYTYVHIYSIYIFVLPVHRRQLREVLGIRKRELRNEELYAKCGTKKLKEGVTRRRWKLFGHVLRLNKKTPAQIAMDNYTQLKEGEKEPLGRPETTLPVILFSEYKKNKQEENEGRLYERSKQKMLEELRNMAWDRKDWGDLVASISKC